MALTKTEKEIAIIIEGGKILGEVLQRLMEFSVAGKTTAQVDALAQQLIREAGGTPSFKGYAPHGEPPFPSTICASLNEAVVHAPASDTAVLKDGDIFSIDIGMQWRGLYTDTAVTFAIGAIPKKTKELLETTQQALYAGIAQCVPGSTVADIGKAVQDRVAPKGYGIVKGLVGHGVGHRVHEPPQIPNYFVKSNRDIVLKRGMVLALEPMITMGSDEIETLDDEWTIVTTDRSLSAHFEHTVVVTGEGPVVATKRPNETV